MTKQTDLDAIKSASPLGKTTAYIKEYDPRLLYPIPRSLKRDEIGIKETLPFYGVDIWNAYEMSWLNQKGKPMVAMMIIEVPCDSENIFESKSLKLYLTSFNNTRFNNISDVQAALEKDLAKATKSKIKITLTLIQDCEEQILTKLPGQNIDDLDISIETYQPEISYLATEGEVVSEELNTDLLKSNCLVTNQPDWASLYINYRGPKINHEGLLKYIISLREHNEFHEQCVERIFMNLLQHCQPESLTVYARYTRRGGIDINPYRTTEKNFNVINARLFRQ